MFADVRRIGLAVARYGRCRPAPRGGQEVDGSATDVESPSNANAKWVPNDRLKDRLRAKGLSPQRFATLDMHPSMRLRITHYLQHRASPYLG